MPLPSQPAIPAVRPARPSDLAALLALEEASFASDRISRRQYRRHLSSDSAQVLVVDDGDGRCLGSAVVFFRRGSRAARLYSLASHAEARGRGIGSTLLAAAEAAAHRRGCGVMRLEVRTDNDAARRLYEQRGYRRSAVLGGFYEDGADAWRYEKALP